MINTITFDFETTTYATGNAFSRRNRAVCLSLKHDEEPATCHYEDLDKTKIEPGSLLIGFNLKFDLHWLKRCGISYDGCKVWCCQLAEFILERQTNPYPSLANTAIKYGLPAKLDVVKTEYWEKGIDTPDVPREILTEYANHDVELTYMVYLKQKEQFDKEPGLYKLFKLQCMDLLILTEMEANGLVYDKELCNKRKDETLLELEAVRKELSSVYKDVPINFGSDNQVSCFLYGGTIKETVKEPDGFYKTGQKAGQIKYKNVVKEHTLPRMCQPLAKTEAAKEGYFLTNKKTLAKLKGSFAKKYVPLLLEVSKLEKLISSYFVGLQKTNEEFDWPDGMLHGQYNQCTARTGRLSSEKPNQQNISGKVKSIFITRME